MEIYGEFFFIENLIADGAIAALTLRLWRRKVFSGNYIIAVLLMTMYSFFIFMPYSSITYSIPAKIAFTLMVVKLLFFDSNLKIFIQGVITFLGVGMVMGGAVTFSIYIMENEGISSSGVIYVQPESYPIIIGVIVISYIFIRVFFWLLSDGRSKAELCVDVKIEIGDYECDLKAVVDTGNFLRDPLDNLPVMLAEAESIKPILKKLIGKVRIRVIPYKSVGLDSGTLMGIKVDKIMIKDDNKSYEGMPGIIAVYSGSFGLKNGCNAIMHPEILKKEAADNAAWNNL